MHQNKNMKQNKTKRHHTQNDFLCLPCRSTLPIISSLEKKKTANSDVYSHFPSIVRVADNMKTNKNMYLQCFCVQLMAC